jgi:hypothetical protein
MAIGSRHSSYPARKDAAWAGSGRIWSVGSTPALKETLIPGTWRGFRQSKGRLGCEESTIPAASANTCEKPSVEIVPYVMSKRLVSFVILLALAISTYLLFKHRAHDDDPGSSQLSKGNRQSPGTGVPLPAPVSIIKQGFDQYKKRQEVELDWRTPIEFYGLVIDQDGNPLPGADVSFTWTDRSKAGHSTRRTISEANGSFALKGVTGKHLLVQVGKSGYYTSASNLSSFFYAGETVNFVPVKSNRVVFHVRRKGNAEPLLVTEYPGSGRYAHLPPTGKPVEIDLMKRKMPVEDAGGQLRLEFWAPDQKTGEKFDWRCRVSLPHGGIVETTNEFNFQAPEHGFLPLAEINMPLTLEKQWQSTISREYFLSLADGKYGRLKFTLFAFNGVFHVHAFVNPSGSRNLEYDSNAQPGQTILE